MPSVKIENNRPTFTATFGRGIICSASGYFSRAFLSSKAFRRRPFDTFIPVSPPAQEAKKSNFRWSKLRR